MAELPKVVLQHLWEQSGQRLPDLQHVLETEFSDATISIIMGYDHFDEHTYVKNAYFRRKQALKAKSKIPPNGSGDLSDTFSVITTTPREMRSGALPIEEVQQLMIYSHLLVYLEKINERGHPQDNK